MRPLRHISFATAAGHFSVTGPRPHATEIVLDPLDPLDLVKLTPLMRLTDGRAETTIGLIDGPVVTTHPDMAGAKVREMPGTRGGTCARAGSAACVHGTFVAGILCAKRGSAAPAVCPNCTLLVRPIFAETTQANGPMPSATPEELAAAIIDCVNSGAHVINLSAALVRPSSRGERSLEEALNYSARRGVIVVAAAGNQGTVGSSAITRHPWVIPVTACDLRGRPVGFSNLGHSIGRRGLGAPGVGVTSLGADGKHHTFGGTSTAAPFVTGAVALLWSEFPGATAAAVRNAVTRPVAVRRTGVAPPLLDAWAAYQLMATTHGGRRVS
ncbi:MAG TPA: S8 family serine peptidase [Pyrinomonadaceae bacterium]|nr:S8 family serine peptidase [Pyrinomonadaceae bacterium]